MNKFFYAVIVVFVLVLVFLAWVTVSQADELTGAIAKAIPSASQVTQIDTFCQAILQNVFILAVLTLGIAGFLIYLYISRLSERKDYEAFKSHVQSLEEHNSHLSSLLAQHNIINRRSRDLPVSIDRRKGD